MPCETPHNWPEFIWNVCKALGWATMSVLTVVAIIGAVAYRTLPNWVDSTVAVQKSLTDNLEQQTKNIIAQTANIEAQTEAIVEVRQAVMLIVESTKMRDEDWKQFTSDVTAVHDRQIITQGKIVENQDKIVQKLEDILKHELGPTPQP
jgi:SMC interacting uncharacterized protein involved in chromosome segregation